MPDPKRIIYDLGELHDMPERVRPFFSQRQFIHFGYRAHVNMTFCRCTATIFKWHCEAGSVWTHFASSLYSAYHLYLILTNQPPYDILKTQQSKDFLILGCIGGMTCTINSAIYHQYNAMSRHLEYMLLQFDYVGVGATLYTLSLLLTHCFFHTSQMHRDNILSAMLVLYFCNGLIQILPCYAPEQYLLHKNILFLGCGFSTVIIANLWAFFYADSEEFRLFAFSYSWRTSILRQGFPFS